MSEDRYDAARALGMVPARDSEGLPYHLYGAQIWLFPDEQQYGPPQIEGRNRERD